MMEVKGLPYLFRMLLIEPITIGNALYGEIVRIVHLHHGVKNGNIVEKAMDSILPLCLQATVGSVLKLLHSSNTYHDSLTFG